MNTNKIREALKNLSECTNIAINIPGGITRKEWYAYNSLAKEALDELDKALKVLNDEEAKSIAYSLSNERMGDYHDGLLFGLRYARDNGYLAPAAGLTVDEAEDCIVEHLQQHGCDFGVIGRYHLRARLTAAIEAKQNP